MRLIPIEGKFLAGPDVRGYEWGSRSYSRVGGSYLFGAVNVAPPAGAVLEADTKPPSAVANQAREQAKALRQDGSAIVRIKLSD